MITTMRARLDADGLTTRVAAMDETNPDVFRANWDAYGPAAKSAVGRLNTHTYSTGGRTGVRDIAKGTGTPLWMSEVDLGGSVGQSFTDMSPALDLSQRINEDFRELEPGAWVLWQAVEDYENMTPGRENSNWGLIQTDFTPADAATEPLRKNKKYWAMANYTRFVRPGARVINTDNADTFAALRPGGRGAVVVHTNPTGEPQRLTLNLCFRNAGTEAVQRYTTDGTRNLQREGDLAPTGRTLTATVGAGSVTTFVLPGATGVNTSDTTAPHRRRAPTPQRQQRKSPGGRHGQRRQHPGPAHVQPRHRGAAVEVHQARLRRPRQHRGLPRNERRRRQGARGPGRLPGARGPRRFGRAEVDAVHPWATGATPSSTPAGKLPGRRRRVHERRRVRRRPPTDGFSANQSWTFRSVAPDTWTPLRMRHGGMCLGVSGAATADGARVVQSGCGSTAERQWSLRSVGGGYVNVVARHSGKCLDVSGESASDGATVFQYGCNGGVNQQWSAHRSADGFITLLARHSGKCLDARGASGPDGAEVTQYTCAPGAEQQLSTS